MVEHDNSWYVHNRDAAADLKSRAAELRKEALALGIQANHLESMADELSKATTIFEGQAIYVTNLGTDQWYLQSLPAARSAIIHRDRTVEDGSWSGVVEDTKGKKILLGGGWKPEEVSLVAKTWVAFGGLPDTEN